MNGENKGLELSIIKGITGIDFTNAAPRSKRRLLITLLHDILFINYLNGKAQYEINKIWYIIIEPCPYVAGVKYVGRSRTKRRHAISRRRRYEW